ncbi:sensor histidine kinase [Cryptosporangium minutisporangium]|uniref:histidine kinase n=1 Tax=Cryptosporangium minutisporangium TaxID=113569 RepID=A0ABP6TBU9_9ACTN
MRSWARVVTAAVPCVGAATVSAVVLGLLLARANGHGAGDLVRENLANNGVLGVGFAVAAVLVLRTDPAHLLGWVFLAEAVLNTVTLTGQQWAEHGTLPLSGLAAWISSFAWWPAYLLLAGAIPLLYPDGRLPSRRWRPVGYLATVATAVAALAFALSDQLLADSFPTLVNPLAPSGVPDGAMVAVAAAGLLVCAGCGLAGLTSVAIRMRRAVGEERGRLAWFLAALLLLIVVNVAGLSNWIVLVAVAFLPVALGVAVVRHGLYNGDRLLNRTLVYTALTGLIIGVFAIVVGLLGHGLGGPGTGAVIAAVVVAAGLNPARALVQRAVDRLLYGQRRDPYAALTGLGDRLSDALSPADVLPIVARTLTIALRLPYAAVLLGDDELPAAAHGEPAGTSVTLPVHHTGQQVGRLVVGLRSGQRTLDHGDEQLLRDFLPYVGVAVHTARLTDDLRRSHDRALRAGDQERHRIRRDLHDGLGSTLAGLALGIGAVRRSPGGRDPQTARLLTQLQDELRQCLQDVRDLVAHLRPTPLDEVGLLEALRQHADALSERSDGSLTVTVSAAEPLPLLDAGVDLAAYRIAMEAMTNVARHAHARQCAVELGAVELGTGAGAIRLVVTDDGVGLSARGQQGLGLRSMSERARELGGSCEFTAAEPSGVTVTATLPLGRTA